MKNTYRVEIKSIGGWTTHSDHDSYREAIDQADMVHGCVRILIDGEAGCLDITAHAYAVACGYAGDYAEWSAQDDDERSEHEIAAQGVVPDA